MTVSLSSKKTPSKEWKLSVLYPEHSPIRSCLYRITIIGLKSWIAVHFVRHHVGVQPFVSTQRPDRTDPTIQRDNIPQGALVDMNLVLNAQSVINISRRRLCSCASPETRAVWIQVLTELGKLDPELQSVSVKECVYRGFCPEKNTCGYYSTLNFTNNLINYRKGVNNGWKEKKIESGLESEVREVFSGSQEKQGQTKKQTRNPNSRPTSKKRRTLDSLGKSKGTNRTKQLPISSEVRNIEHQTTE